MKMNKITMGRILELETEEALEAVEKALLEAKHEELYILQGMIHERNYETELALESYDKSIEFNPENYLCYLAKAKFYMKEYESDKANEFFQIAVDKKACRESLYNLGRYYAYENEEEKAIENFTGAIESQDDTMFFGNKIIYDERGMCNYCANHYENAVNDYWKAFELSEKSFNPYLRVSNAYRGWEKYENVIEISNQFKKLNAEDVSFDVNDGAYEIYDNTIYAYENMEKYDLAIQECDEFIAWAQKNDNIDDNPYIKKAKIYLKKLNDEEKSDAAIEEILILKSDDCNVINHITLFYDTTQQYHKNIDLVNKLDRKIFEDAAYVERAVIMRQAEAYFKLKNYEKAIEVCQKAKELDPEDSDSFELLMHIYHEQGKKDEALQEFDKAYEINGNNHYFLVRKMRLCTDWEYLDEALETCEFLIEKEYDVSDMYFDKGIILTAMNKLPEALAAYSVSLDLNKKSVRPYINMHYLHRDLGMDDEAITDSTIVIESDNDSIKHIAYYQRSSRNYARGTIEQAIEDMDNALRFKSDFKSAAIDLSEMLMVGGYIEKGMKTLEDNKLLFDDPKGKTIYYYLKFLGHTLLKETDEAETAKVNFIEEGKRVSEDFGFGIKNLENNIKTDKETLQKIMEVGLIYFG